MNSSLRKIDKNKVNNLKRFFENLVCSSKGNNLIQRDKNNNNSNESSITDNGSINPHLTHDEIMVKKKTFSDSKIDFNKIKFKNEKNKKIESNKKNEEDNEKITSDQACQSLLDTNLKNSDQISIKSLSKCSLMSDFLSDQESIDLKKNIQVIYQDNQEIQNRTTLIDKEQKSNSFTFNLFKLLKLMLTAKCYCVLLTEKKNSSDLKKLIFILYEMKQTALKKLSNINPTEIENAKLNDFLLADLFNILCEIHVMSPEFKKFLKCSYNFECSQQVKESSFIDNEILNDVQSLFKEKFCPTSLEDFKLPKLSISKDAFLHKYNEQIIQKPSQTTITSSNISNLTFQNANSEFEKNSNNNCQKRKIAYSNNSEASFVAMLKLNDDISKFLVYKNRPRNQFILLSNDTKI